MNIEFTTRVFKEGPKFVAHALELDVSSCGDTKEQAVEHIQEAVRLFLEEAAKMGTVDEILTDAGYVRNERGLEAQLMSVQRMSVALPLINAEA